VHRGEVWWLDMPAPECGAASPASRRPVVVVSNNAANRNLSRVVVVPLTANGDRQYPGEARVTLSDKPCKVSTDQITAVPKSALSERIAVLSKTDLQAVEEALQIHLALPR
jgi:mRNA interferase MazF